MQRVFTVNMLFPALEQMVMPADISCVCDNMDDDEMMMLNVLYKDSDPVKLVSWWPRLSAAVRVGLILTLPDEKYDAFVKQAIKIYPVVV